MTVLNLFDSRATAGRWLADVHGHPLSIVEAIEGERVVFGHRYEAF